MLVLSVPVWKQSRPLQLLKKREHVWKRSGWQQLLMKIVNELKLQQKQKQPLLPLRKQLLWKRRQMQKRRGWLKPGSEYQYRLCRCTGTLRHLMLYLMMTMACHQLPWHLCLDQRNATRQDPKLRLRHPQPRQLLALLPVLDELLSLLAVHRQ
jgi:hypothetical protein